MTTAKSQNDLAWQAYRGMRLAADHTGDPKLRAKADDFRRQFLMGAPVRHDAYSQDGGEHIAHDSAAPITAAPIIQDKYRHWPDAPPHTAHHAKPTPASSSRASRSKTVQQDAYARFRL